MDSAMDFLPHFINVLMKCGKKSIAESIIYGALDVLSERAKKAKRTDEEGAEGGSADSIIQYFEKALDNVRPHLEVRSRRVGGATYQVPVEVRWDRSTALAMRWVTSSARARGEKGMMLRLAGELADAYENKGAAVKRRETAHQMAKANQAFAHFRLS